MSKIYAVKVTGQISEKIGSGNVPITVETIPVHVVVTLSDGFGMRFTEGFCEHEEFSTELATDTVELDVAIYKVQGKELYMGTLSMYVTDQNYGDTSMLHPINTDSNASVFLSEESLSEFTLTMVQEEKSGFTVELEFRPAFQ